MLTSKGDLGRFGKDGIDHTFTATGATTVNIAYPNITDDSVVLFALKTVGGTVAGTPYLFTKTPGTGFGVRTSASDTSVYIFRVI